MAWPEGSLAQKKNRAALFFPRKQLEWNFASLLGQLGPQFAGRRQPKAESMLGQPRGLLESCNNGKNNQSMLVLLFWRQSLARAAALQNLEPSKLLRLCMVQGWIPCDWPQWLDHFVLGFFLAGAEDVAASSSSSSFLCVTGELAVILATIWRMGMTAGPCFTVAHCVLAALDWPLLPTMVPCSWNWRSCFQLWPTA